MSLDVYLTLKSIQNVDFGSRIFIREDGQNKEITRAQWDERFPDREPILVQPIDDSDEVYSANITHNLNTMANEAGIYQYLWMPEELEITRASQLIEPLRTGLVLLESDPIRFKEFNPANGWGNYDGLVQFVKDYLRACEEYPDAEVSAWR